MPQKQKPNTLNTEPWSFHIVFTMLFCLCVCVCMHARITERGGQGLSVFLVKLCSLRAALSDWGLASFPPTHSSWPNYMRKNRKYLYNTEPSPHWNKQHSSELMPVYQFLAPSLCFLRSKSCLLHSHPLHLFDGWCSLFCHLPIRMDFINCVWKWIGLPLRATLSSFNLPPSPPSQSPSCSLTAEQLGRLTAWRSTQHSSPLSSCKLIFYSQTEASLDLCFYVYFIHA